MTGVPPGRGHRPHRWTAQMKTLTRLISRITYLQRRLPFLHLIHSLFDPILERPLWALLRTFGGGCRCSGSRCRSRGLYVVHNLAPSFLELPLLFLFFSGELAGLFGFESTIPQLFQERLHPLCELCGESICKGVIRRRTRCFLRRGRWYRLPGCFRWFSRSSGLWRGRRELFKNVYCRRSARSASTIDPNQYHPDRQRRHRRG